MAGLAYPGIGNPNHALNESCPAERSCLVMAVNRQPEADEFGGDDEMEVVTTTAQQGKGRRRRTTVQMPPMKERLYSSYYRFRYGWFT